MIKNFVHSWKRHSRFALLFLEVIHEISRSNGLKNRWKIDDLDSIERFRTVWIFRLLRNDAQSWKWHRKGAILLFWLICPIARSQGPKNRFEQHYNRSQLSNPSDLPCVNVRTFSIWIHKWLQMTHVASRRTEEILYRFSRSSVIFQSHTGWKIDISQITSSLSGIKSLGSSLFKYIHSWHMKTKDLRQSHC